MHHMASGSVRSTGVRLRLALLLVAFLLLSFILYAMLHEVGHVLFLLASGGRITSVTFSLDPTTFGIRMSYDVGRLADIVNGYVGGLFSAAVMLLVYFGLHRMFVRKSFRQTLALGIFWFAAIGLGLSHAVTEGASRQLYLGNALFDNVTGTLGVLFGIAAYCRYVFVPPRPFKPRNALARMMFGR